MSTSNINFTSLGVGGGMPGSDWISFSASGSWTTNTTYTGFYRRVGDSMEIAISLLLSGAPGGTSDLSFDLPSGFTIDTAKIPNASGQRTVLGTTSVYDASSGVSYHGTVVYFNSTKSYAGFDGGVGIINFTAPVTFAVNDVVTVRYMVPISGWTAGSQQVTGPVSSPISASDINWASTFYAGGVFTKTLSANTTFTFSNQVAGQVIMVRLTNTASNFTVTWPSVKWVGGTAPTMTGGAVSDIYTFVYDGTNTFGSVVQNLS